MCPLASVWPVNFYILQKKYMEYCWGRSTRDGNAAYFFAAENAKRQIHSNHEDFDADLPWRILVWIMSIGKNC